MIQEALRSNLMTLAQHYSYLTGENMRAVGRTIANDSEFFLRIKTGDFRTGTYDKVLVKFHKNWPDGAAWPPHIERPSKVEAA